MSSIREQWNARRPTFADSRGCDPLARRHDHDDASCIPS
jgi:hypothetical protein